MNKRGSSLMQAMFDDLRDEGPELLQDISDEILEDVCSLLKEELSDRQRTLTGHFKDMGISLDEDD